MWANNEEGNPRSLVIDHAEANLEFGHVMRARDRPPFATSGMQTCRGLVRLCRDPRLCVSCTSSIEPNLARSIIAYIEEIYEFSNRTKNAVLSVAYDAVPLRITSTSV